MRLEIAERLCCPAPHAPTPLVVVAERVVERDLVEGRAGCPVCRAEARVHEGDAWFAAPGASPAPGATALGATAASPPPDPADDAAALERLVALLGLSEPGGTVLLTGAYARFAERLAADAEFGVVIVDPAPAARPGWVRGLALSTVHGVTSRLPFTDATFRGAALDAALAAPLVEDAVRTVVVGGRVVAGAALARPVGLRELARDPAEWVAEREAAAPLVTLGRRADA